MNILQLRKTAAHFIPGAAQWSRGMGNEWRKCGDAYRALKRRFASHNSLTIRKAIIGMIKAGELRVIADVYTETALVYLTQEIVPKISDPMGVHEQGNSPPFDFWRYGMACGSEADSCFEASVFSSELDRLAWQLPYRFFKYQYQADRSPAGLSQIAQGVRFFGSDLDALFADRRWARVWPHRAEPKPPGRRKQWAWDKVKAALTVETARNPDLLKGSAAELVRKMQELFDVFEPQGGEPDRSDLFQYADRIMIQAILPEPAP